MKKFFTTVIAWNCLIPFALKAEDADVTHSPSDARIWFKHMDVGVTVGSTGIGVDLASQIGDYVQLRTGFAYMPSFHYKMTFLVENYDDNGNLLHTKFDDLAHTLESVTGYKVDQNIDMIGVPTYYNFKFLVDVFPFSNKHWHFTAGFYAGPERFAKAYNTTEDMPSLMAVGIYNHLYDYIKNTDFIEQPIYNNVYLDPDMADELKAKMASYGRMAIQIGNKKNGEPYMVTPDENGMVKAKVLVNRFKPYVGFGYNNFTSKDQKTNVSCDFGVMFWGGTPKIVTHDGTDIAHDVDDIAGKVGRYVDVVKTFKVFPVISIKVSRRLY